MLLLNNVYFLLMFFFPSMSGFPLKGLSALTMGVSAAVQKSAFYKTPSKTSFTVSFNPFLSHLKMQFDLLLVCCKFFNQVRKVNFLCFR